MAIHINTATADFIHAHEADDVSRCALMKVGKDVDLRFALEQIEGRQIARKKIPLYAATDEIIYPVKLSMEQCSSQQTAEYKAAVAGSGETMVDLTAGLGVDFSFICRGFRHAVHVERNARLSEIAAHNISALGLHQALCECEDAESYLSQMGRVDLIYLDPARRDANGRKTVRIEECEPDVLAMKDTLLDRADRVLVKFSPMLDVASAVHELGCVAEVHVVSANGECKELLLLLRKSDAPLTYHCVDILRDGELRTLVYNADESDSITIPYANPSAYLYEPNPSIMKANAHAALAAAYTSVRKVAPFSHLYTSDELIPDFPGRSFRIVSQCSLSKQDLKQYLSDTKKANITVRNFPLSVDELRRKLKMHDGGSTYLFATTLQDSSHVIIRCEKV